MAERPCPVCRQPIVRAWISTDVERTFDAEQVEGGEWGVWSQTVGLNVVQRARLRTAENHFGSAGYALHACPGAAGTQLEIGAA